MLKIYDLLIRFNLYMIANHAHMKRYSYKFEFEEWKKYLRHHDITSDVINLLDGIPQGTYYHPEYDALMHTFFVIKAVKEIGRTDLIEAAFLHDVGKAFTTNIGRNRIYHFGHPEKSLEFIDKPNVKSRLKNYDLVHHLVKNHMNQIGKKTKNDLDLQCFQVADKIIAENLYRIRASYYDVFKNKLKEKTLLFSRKFNRKKVYVLVGISGSGKSTYLKRFKSEYIVSPDILRRKLSTNVSDQSDNKYIWTLTKHLMRMKLNRYGKVILDATNVVKFSRVPFMSNFNDAKKIAIVFDVDVEDAIKRVTKDIENGVDRANVPEEVIRRQHKNFKKGEMSLRNEFDKVIYRKKEK